ncbi:MAG TPA: hybrid sensor histidine kinase/response regulator [Vicinamibacterales bacterium]|jgi:signal transduction histidine kinase
MSTRQPWGAALLPLVDPESFQQVLATRRPTIGDIRASPRGDPGYLFAIRVPVLRQSNLKYVLSAVLAADSLAAVVPPQLPNSDEWTRTILDTGGTIVVRTRGAGGYIGSRADEDFFASVQQTHEAVLRRTTREGVGVYAAFSRATSGWTAIIVVPRDVFDTPLVASMTGVLTGGALLMLSGLIAVLSVSRRLSTDLAGATAAAEAVAEGRPVAQAGAHTVETEQLQRSLTTAASLLEKRARERDEEIRRADEARTEAVEANRTKDRFLAVLGHELRNPLAPALTALELMKLRDPNVFTRERDVIGRQIAHMSRLVDDLLDISRLSQGKIQLSRHRFDLRDAVDRAVDMARPLLVQHRHALDVSVASGLSIEGDIDRIVQVLSNLLTNAARYTPVGGHVRLAASASGDRAIIVCEDNGAGVPDELLPKLFEPFAQGPRALDRREGGLGLGLALARTFTELHDGTISYETRPEGGARFMVTLPLAALELPLAFDESNRQDSYTAAQRILVVDDNDDACDMLKLALQHAGYVVAVAGDGPDAIATAAEFRPAVGVLDIGLPGMDGYELARHLRTSHPGIRLIALTGYAQVWDLKAAAAAGFDAHLAKPIATTVLLDRIDGVAMSDS